MLLYDSFQGKCKRWIESFPAKSIKSFEDFWFMFLEEWIDRSEVVAISPSIQGFKQWNDHHTNDEIDQNFSLFLSSYLKTFDCKTEDKMKFLDEVADDIEKEIEGLKGQIQSYSLHNHDHYFQKLSMAEHKERVLLPFSFTIEEEFTVVEDQFIQPESYKNHHANHVFWDPIAKYMEEFYSPVFQFSYENQKPFQRQWSSQYHSDSELRCDAVKKLKYQIRQMIGYIGNFTLIELKEV